MIPVIVTKIENSGLNFCSFNIVVTHSMQQASRVSQRTAYFHLGDLIEIGSPEQIFLNPLHQLTQDYITGRLG